MITHDNRESYHPSRRAFLGILGVGAAAALLAGCDNSGTANHAADIVPTDDSDVDPTPSPTVADTQSYAPPVTFKPEVNATPTPTRTLPVTNSFGVLPRSVWAHGGPNLRTIQPMNGVRLLTFHHSGDPKPFTLNGFWETAHQLELIREYHRRRGFQDIGYHFAIDREGRLWQLRSLKYQGEHVHGHNEHNIGVVALGNFDLQHPTAAQKEKMISFGHLLRTQYRLAVRQVWTHQELTATLCPGYHMQPYMRHIRGLSIRGKSFRRVSKPLI